MPRTEAIFKFVLSLPMTTDYSIYMYSQIPSYEVTYVPAAAGIPDAHLLQIRQEKELAALIQFEENVVPMIHSFQALHHWLFMDHNAYAASRLMAPVADIPADLLKTY